MTLRTNDKFTNEFKDMLRQVIAEEIYPRFDELNEEIHKLRHELHSYQHLLQSILEKQQKNDDSNAEIE